MYVSYAPELDIAACGETVEQAKLNLQKVVRINFDEMKRMGTLEAFLRDSGFEIDGNSSELVTSDKELIGFAPTEILF